MLNVLVVDAQGGGLGAALVKKLNEKYANRIRVSAAGVNAAAASAMKKAGAAQCASGESDVCALAYGADVIMGGIGIIAAGGMVGEITPRIARTVAESPAKKILVPISRCSLVIAGAGSRTAAELISLAADEIESLL